MNRRKLLQGLGWTAAGLTIPVLPACAVIPPIPKRPKVRENDLLGWVQLRPDGRVLVVAPRQEIGQNILTAFRQIVAEELEAPLDVIEVRLHDTLTFPRVSSTVGSESLSVCAEPLARSAATLRLEIDRRASARLQVETSELSRTAGGDITAEGRRISLAELARSSSLLLSAPPAPDIMTRTFAGGSRRYVGQASPLVQGVAIVTGAPLYSGDVTLPGMVFGAVLHPPWPSSRGMAPLGVDEAAAARLPGFIKLVRARGLSGEMWGVVAQKSWQLDAIVAALNPVWPKARTLDEGTLNAALNVDEHLSRGSLRHDVVKGKTQDDEPWTVSMRIKTPLASHAALEPRTAVASWHADSDPRLEVWTGTQDAFFVSDVLARAMGTPAKQIQVHSRRVGGAFGGKTIPMAEIEAAMLSRAVDAPVKVVWTRRQEFQRSFYRPPTTHRLRLRVGADGRLRDWSHNFLSGHVLFSNAVLPAWLQKATDFIGDGGVERGSRPLYVANRTQVAFDAIRLPVHTGPWRGLGAGPNGFAIESAVDEAAIQSGHEPLAFRLANLAPENGRLKACLERVGQLAPPLAAGRRGIGRGYACGTYKDASHVAVAADVEVGTDGTVRVRRMVCVIDCGRIINPDQVRAQTEGNLIWGLGMVLSEELGFEENGVREKNYFDYGIPRLEDTPVLEIEMIEPPGAPIAGAGETAIVASGAAIANAIRYATGVRILELPVNRQALQARRDPVPRT